MKLLLLLCFSAACVFAQSGDNPGEVQPPLPASIKIPPAPPLPVEEALKSFRLQPGFEIEVVASEPMIEAPVAIEFDPDGRLYVLEMRGFMPNVDGTGEDQPVGRVSLLEDDDGDGRMDKSTVFVDGLVMPRAIAAVRGGLLIAEPPYLWFYKDTSGDGRADHKEELSRDYGSQGNPEHTANGLLWARDNWIYSANHTIRYRNISGEWESAATLFRGQWGISQDDYGRLFYNSNSDQLRGDLVPAEYLERNPNFKTAFGRNVQIARDQSTFPIRVNPGVNRGYQAGTLRPDGTLAKFTGACGPVIYRGSLFPQKYYGAAFLCEPTANFVRCNFLQEKNGMITATNAFPNEEFLASTDERFRPVNLFNGPDGALYVVDMYRGVIQHKLYITTFLRNQALERGLEKPLTQGRIYRVVPTGASRKPAPRLSRLSSRDLVKQLESNEGWVRDTAQQLLVEKRDAASVEPLRILAASGRFPAAVHALWALHALAEVDPATAIQALNSREARVRATAVRVSEPLLLSAGAPEVKERILALSSEASAEVQVQLMFSLGESESPQALAAMLELLERNPEPPLLRSAALSGLNQRELPFLREVLRREFWSHRTGAREELIRGLARCVAESREPARVNELLAIAAEQKEIWQQHAILDGIRALIPTAGRGKTAAPPKPLQFAAEPDGLRLLKARKEFGIDQRLSALDPLLLWPTKSGFAAPDAKPLSAEEKKLFESGRAQYALLCGACHQQNGLGLEGLAPPLMDSEWVTGSPDRLTRIVLHGMRGPVTVKGRMWELEMPPLGILSDRDIAGLLTYIRREWGHTAAPITPEYVAQVRAATADREEAWTEAELLNIAAE